MIFGEATRVFKVKHLETGEECMLKDAWIEDGWELEHVIRERILDDVKLQHGEDAKKVVASHAVTPINNWLVRVNGQEDHTMHVMMRGFTVSRENLFGIRRQLRYRNTMRVGPPRWDDEDVDENFHALLMQMKCPVFRHRKHYRIVFQEVVDTVWTVTNLTEAFVVLRDCTQGITDRFLSFLTTSNYRAALKYIHGCGWVHQGITAADVHLFAGRGLIGNFEFTKTMLIGDAHQRWEVRTFHQDL